jgi:hypothetical protein
MRLQPIPPPQWLTPGSRKSRANLRVCAKLCLLPCVVSFTAVYQFTMSCGENGPSVCGCQISSLPP